MSTCWKCQKEIPFGVECEDGCAHDVPVNGEHVEKVIEEMKARHARMIAASVEIDWLKVKTVQDVIRVLAMFHDGARVLRDSPQGQSLKQFWKE